MSVTQSYSTKIPSVMDISAGSCTWPDSVIGLASGMKMASGVGSGTGFVVGSGSVTVVGSGLRSMVGVAEDWLVSGSVAGLVLSSSAMQMVRGEPHCTNTHSTYSAELPQRPSPDSLAFVEVLSPT